MAIVQCPNNHYYDNTRSNSCPYCEKMSAVNAYEENSVNEQLTSLYAEVEQDDAQLTEGYGEAVEEYEKTIGIFVDESHNLLTVGWLVCVEGSEKGKNYTLVSGRNFVGRSDDMDVVLAGDMKISENKHFSVVYDPKSIGFYIVAGSGHTYVNGNAVASEQEIFDGDVIQVGDCKYIFVPYCKEGREWK